MTTSADALRWGQPVTMLRPTQPWELIQLGPCSSPLETSQGWVVITHGVGPMRTYSLGAALLDLQDPTIVLGTLTQPLMTAGPDERDGYVPNVLYSCGGLIHGETIVLPYGCSDSSIRFAFIDLAGLLAQLSDAGTTGPSPSLDDLDEAPRHTCSPHPLGNRQTTGVTMQIARQRAHPDNLST